MTETDRTWWQDLLRRGYAPEGFHLQFAPVFFLRDKSGFFQPSPSELPSLEDAVPGIAFIFVTMLRRCTLPEQLDAFKEFAKQVVQAKTAHPGYQFYCCLALQAPPQDYARATERLNLLFNETGDGCRAIGAVIPESAKVVSLNAYFRLFSTTDVRGLGWIDDDVRLEPNCLSELVSSFLSAAARAHGALKCPHPKEMTASRALHSAKNIMSTPQTRYPHGCCILVDRARFCKGIDDRYICDDGFICFELLQPKSPTPLKDLVIVNSAICHHFVGGSAKEVYFRIRRSLLSVAIFIADYSTDKARFYLTRIQFYGLWPVASIDPSKGWSYATKKWCLKAILLLWFSEIVLELAFRSIVRRPLRSIDWAGYSWHARRTIA